jgi:folate-binding protein YgfZ
MEWEPTAPYLPLQSFEVMVRSAQQDTSTAEEYEALTKGAALVDRSAVGRLRFGGKDALDLLNRLSTNQLLDLAPGQGRPTVLTSNKGRIIDLLIVFRLEGHLLVLTSGEARQKVAEYIDFYTFSEDVGLRDVTPETAILSVTGPMAEEALLRVGIEVQGIAPYSALPASADGTEVLVLRSDFFGTPGYDLVVSKEKAEIVRERLGGIGAIPVGVEALEAVRIERGVPAYGCELGEEYNPHEAGLLPFVSFTKGCYVGQEVVTRLNTYDKVQRRLVGLRWKSEWLPEKGAAISAGSEAVGAVTSVARQPVAKAGIGLGYVRKGIPTGSHVVIAAAGGSLEAQLVEHGGLPPTPSS